MTPIEFQQWLNAHGQSVVVDGKLGPVTRTAIKDVFVNNCAPAINDADITVLASRLGCSVKQIKAVAQVESGGAAFDKGKRPKILFERHLFHRFTNGVYGVTSYSSPKGGGYAEDSWEKLTQAACKDVQAAFGATSWGKFQVIGAHAHGGYKGFLDLGYPSPLEMAYTSTINEAAHYEMLMRYVEKTGLKPAMIKLSTNPEDCRAFAKGYNGSQYEKFQYHIKLAKAMK